MLEHGDNVVSGDEAVRTFGCRSSRSTSSSGEPLDQAVRCRLTLARGMGWDRSAGTRRTT